MNSMVLRLAATSSRLSSHDAMNSESACSIDVAVIEPCFESKNIEHR